MTDLRNVRGVLCDLDGTLYVGSRVVPGAAEAVEFLRARGLRMRFLTNTTTRSRSSLYHHVASLGLKIKPDEIYSAAYAGVLYVRELGNPRVRLVLKPDARSDYEEFPTDDEKPKAIVVGDIGDAWNYNLLNSLFRQALNGARLVALHKNRYYRTTDGLTLDVGAFVAAVEYGSGMQAEVVGKPTPRFFSAALQDMNLPAGQVVIIGDDVEGDIGGARNVGIGGILVKTGKFLSGHEETAVRHGALVAASIGMVPELWLHPIA